ncbi:putative nuclease HARBI1 [Aricia agestis]|uniref:putative nuclease HARBI1 n=1 Tax=Aricia agestis TaxID=91739 RepID=UPI001C20B844|nr:putative nuclease HARBI1 [Aricia agestis]
MFVLRWHIMLLGHEINKKRKGLTQCSKHNSTQKLSKPKLETIPRCKRPSKFTIDPFVELSSSKFIETYGLRKESVKNLIEELKAYIPNPRRSDGIQIHTKVLIALSFYVSGLYQKNLGENVLHHTSQKTVSRSVTQVTDALNCLQSKHIKWPDVVTERDCIKARFNEKFGLPGVVGCVDSMHVAIIKPHVQEEKYHNKEGYHSLNVMIISDADLNILCVDPSNPGSLDDSAAWNNHLLCPLMNQIVESGEEAYLLGDSEYQLSKVLLTPVANCTEGSSEHHYNLKHMTAHNSVKTCINILKARFRCLLSGHPLHYDPVAAGKIVTACCILHNIAVATDTPLPDQSLNDLKSDILLQQMEETLIKPDISWKEIVGRDSMDQDFLENQSQDSSDQRYDVQPQQARHRLWENSE